MKLLNSQKGLTLIEMLVAILLFILASILIITSITHVMDKPKQVAILNDLEEYRYEIEFLFREKGDTLTEQEFKDNLNLALEDASKFKGTNKSTRLNAYGKSYDLGYKVVNGQVEVIVSTTGKSDLTTYSIVALYKDSSTDYCTNGFGRNNKRPTILSSTSCDNTLSEELQPEPPNYGVLEPIKDTLVCTALQGNGTSANPYKIFNGNDLNALRDVSCKGKYVELMNDIDLSNWTTYDNGQGWKPLNFWGYFNGNSYTINNVSIKRPTEMDVSIFGAPVFNLLDLKNLNVRNVDVTGDYQVSLVVSRGLNVNIDNIKAEGRITSNGAAGGVVSVFGGVLKNVNSDVQIEIKGTNIDYAGGVIGYINNRNFLIENAHSKGTIVGGNETGGLIGRIYESIPPTNNTITNSSSSVDLYNSNSYSGGLVGTASYTNFDRVYATGDIKNPLNSVGVYGGLIGLILETTVTNSYSTGKVEKHLLASSSGGGFIAGAQNNSKVTNSYSTGYTGEYGFIVQLTSGSISTNNFYDSITSGSTVVKHANPKTTNQMKQQSTFTGWDFTSIWGLDSTKNNGYPYLKNNPPN